MVLLGILGAGCRDDGGGSEGESTGSTSQGGTDTTPTTTGGPTSETSSSITDASETTQTPSTTTAESSSGTGTDTEDVPATCDDDVVVPGELCFGPPTIVEAGRSTAALQVVDLDGDGVPDIVAGHDDGLSVRFGSGGGAFDVPLELLEGQSVLAVAVGQLDGAGGLDIVAAAPGADQVFVLTATDDGFAQSDVLAPGAGPRALALGDFDDDGIDDLAIALEVEDDFVVAIGLGDGTFTPAPPVPTGTAPLGIAAADLDGLAGDDLVIANFGSGNVGVYLSTRDGFGPGISYAAQAGPRDVVLADFDDDGALDLAAIHQDAGTAGYWPGAGDGTLGERILTVIGANPRDAMATDVDADGVPDMIVALQAGNAVGVLRGAQGRGLASPEVFATMSAPTAVAAADLDADGAVDLLTASAGPQGGIAVILATP